MARPSKPVEIIAFEGKSHRTKREMAVRRDGEKKALTGIKLKATPEVKKDPIAYAEFRRIKKLLEAIDKNDELFGAVINRYCIIVSELKTDEENRAVTQKLITDLQKKKKKDKEYIEYFLSLQKALASIDRSIKDKRSQLFSIEKENGMTLAAALRSVPKKPETKTNALKEALGG